jgi:hypothetical protein
MPAWLVPRRPARRPRSRPILKQRNSAAGAPSAPAARQAARAVHRIFHRRAADHQAGGGQDAVDMGAFNRLVHRHGGTEIVGGDDQAF